MLMTDSSLKCTKQPTLQQRSNPMASRKQVVAQFFGFSNNFVLISRFDQFQVALQSICLDNASRNNKFLNSHCDTISRCRGQTLKPYASYFRVIHFDKNKDKTFSKGSSPTFPWLFTADIYLVCLNNPRELLSTWTHHRPAQFMKPGPSSFITAQPQDSLKTKGAGPTLLGHKPPNRPEPSCQGFSGPLEYSPSNYRLLNVTSDTLIQRAPDRPELLTRTTWTSETVGPAKAKQVIPAGFFRRKTSFKFGNRQGVILHRRRCYTTF